MDGIQEQIENNSEEIGLATEDDFINMIDLLMKPNKSDSKRIFITGIGGILKYVFAVVGRQKLPRKIKKRIYFTKKLRKQYIPEYYK